MLNHRNNVAVTDLRYYFITPAYISYTSDNFSIRIFRNAVPARKHGKRAERVELCRQHAAAVLFLRKGSIKNLLKPYRSKIKSLHSAFKHTLRI
jgi:hypothetical protein